MLCSPRVVESKDPGYPVGSTWLCFFGWQTHAIIRPSEEEAPTAGPSFPKLSAMPDLKGLPQSLALGVLGMTGYVCSLLQLVPPPKLRNIWTLSDSTGRRWLAASRQGESCPNEIN